MWDEKFITTIANTFGAAGKTWLSNLDKTIEELKTLWGLKQIIPCKNLSYNFVAKALDTNNNPVILKISCDPKINEEESKALQYFQGHGSVLLLERNIAYSALLLEQAIPGIALKEIYPAQKDTVIEAYVNCMHNLHSLPAPASGFAPLNNWVDDLDKPCKEIPDDLLQKARELKRRLIVSQTEQKLLHGDLHLDNVLKNKEEWVSIDPKGILGEPAFEIAAFDFISEQEILLADSNLLQSRIRQVADVSKISLQRLKEWTFVRLMLAAVWQIETKEDPGKNITLARLLETHVYPETS